MLHHHQQIVLRNATTGPATLRLFLFLAWSWRNSARRPFTSCLLIVALAIIHSIFFMAAGIFSSTIAGAGDMVLTRSPFCGTFNQTYYDTVNAVGGINTDSQADFGLSLEYLANRERDFQLSQEYTRECYFPSIADSATSCATFQQPRLNWTNSTDGTCPFQSGLCASERFVIDTGLLNTYSDFGINAEPQDQLFYRRVTSCTALNDTGYMTGYVDQGNETDTQPVWQIASANYGESLYFPNTTSTYEYSNFADFYTNFQGLTTTPYQLSAQLAPAGSLGSSSARFIPIAELSQEFADLTLMFLSYTGAYADAEINDPWFSAHQKQQTGAHAALVRTVYTRDRPVSTLGCTEQHQLCPNVTKCTPLLGFWQVQQYMAEAYELTPNQNATLQRLTDSIQESIVGTVVAFLALGSQPLLAIDQTGTKQSTISLPLPDNQWQLELSYWHSIAMAHLQRIFVEYGTGQIAAQKSYLAKPSTDGGRWLCANMMIKGTNMQSFSVLALALMLAFGAAVIITSLTIENLANYVQQKCGRGSARMEMWQENDMLQINVWTKKDEAIKRSATVSKSKMPMRPEKPAEALAQIRPAVDPAPSPNLGRMIHAVSLASYREGFRDGHQGAWV